jgi:hypothetical protein
MAGANNNTTGKTNNSRDDESRSVINSINIGADRVSSLDDYVKLTSNMIELHKLQGVLLGHLEKALSEAGKKDEFLN